MELIGFKGTSAEQGQSKREVRHYCQQCGNCYNAASSLKLHMRACQRPRIMVRHECEVCGKVFKSNKNLKDHMMTHMSIATYRCQRCYRKFIEEDKYVAHMQYHRHQDKLEAAIVAMNDKDRDNKVAREFKCSFCTQNFIVVFELGMVKRRYACDRCRDKFSNVEVLREHKKRAEEKPEFLCDRCGRKFVFEGFMQRHRTNCKGIINRNHNRK
ncbi:hypothetical protein KR018_001950 [Drosophila ironensis]|nr:hypothetical protein KR018_001950 [Drosophila ironensis]